MSEKIKKHISKIHEKLMPYTQKFYEITKKLTNYYHNLLYEYDKNKQKCKYQYNVIAIPYALINVNILTENFMLINSTDKFDIDILYKLMSIGFIETIIKQTITNGDNIKNFLRTIFVNKETIEVFDNVKYENVKLDTIDFINTFNNELSIRGKKWNKYIESDKKNVKFFNQIIETLEYSNILIDFFVDYNINVIYKS